MWLGFLAINLTCGIYSCNDSGMNGCSMAHWNRVTVTRKPGLTRGVNPGFDAPLDPLHWSRSPDVSTR